MRDFSVDVINCFATLKRINYLCDVNTVETLRQIILCLPDYLILRLKSSVTDITEKGCIPTEISSFPYKIEKSEFDPDFGDLERSPRFDTRNNRSESINKWGIYAAMFLLMVELEQRLFAQFSKALGLQGKRERIELLVVGGKQVSQKNSRCVNFWISPIKTIKNFISKLKKMMKLFVALVHWIENGFHHSNILKVWNVHTRKVLLMWCLVFNIVKFMLNRKLEKGSLQDLVGVWLEAKESRNRLFHQSTLFRGLTWKKCMIFNLLEFKLQIGPVPKPWCHWMTE